MPLFLEQRKGGKITITDERMTRFWITLEQGVRFVIDCIGRMHGGEVFIPKIPSMRLMDLVDVVASEAKREISGIRPEEKINEILITEEESRHSRELDDEVLKARIINGFTDNFPDSFDVSVAFVDEIKEPENGKRSYIEQKLQLPF